MNLGLSLKIAQRLLLIPVAFLLISSTVFASDSNMYQAEASVAVYDNDAVVARKKVFHLVQQRIVLQAVREMVEPEVFKLYEKQIKRNIEVKSNRFLLSVRVLLEKSDGVKFLLRLQGRVNKTKISDALTGLKIPKKSDPWRDVRIVFRNEPIFSHADWRRNLSLFHIKVLSFSVDKRIDQVVWDQESIERVFADYQDTQVVYYIWIEAKDGEVGSLIMDILSRGSDMVSGTIRLPLRQSDARLAKNERKRIFSLFNSSSLKLSAFNTSGTSLLTLRIDGISSPMYREGFEREYLLNNPAILNSRISVRSSDSVSYDLKLRGTQRAFLETVLREGGKNRVQLIEKDKNVVRLVYLENEVEEIKELLPWSPVPSVIRQIEERFPTNAGKMKWLPKWQETESNNTIVSPNRMVNNQVTIGKISSRIDEDLYVVECQAKAKGIKLEWMRIGKTELTPQLRLYDDQLNLLATYSMHGNQSSQIIDYTFIDEKIPPKMFIRISDKIGFVPSETGGFKSYNYLLKKITRTVDR